MTTDDGVAIVIVGVFVSITRKFSVLTLAVIVVVVVIVGGILIAVDVTLITDFSIGLGVAVLLIAVVAAGAPGLLIATPGIRPAGADVGDQKRIATPAQAIRDGSDYLVVGRPIVAQPDPAAAARAILANMREGA